MEVNEFCDGLIRSYLGNYTQLPTRIDIDDFACGYLKKKVIYETFAEDDPNKIGFASDGYAPLWVYHNHIKVQCIYPAETIVLEKYLRDRPGNENRRRFTLAHEVGHILVGRISPYTASFRNEHDDQKLYNYEELCQMLSINETQANMMAAALLMPTFLVKETLNRYNGGRRLPVYGNHCMYPREKVIMDKMSQSLGVSYSSLFYRLKKLDAFSYHEIDEYIKKQIH